MYILLCSSNGKFNYIIYQRIYLITGIEYF